VSAKTAQREALLQTIEQKPHLNGRFERMERIDQHGGGGQFSLVFRALDRHTKQDVALKFFDPTQRTDMYRWESFKREIDLLPEFNRKPDILQCLSGLMEFKENFTSQLGIIFGVDFAYYAVELAEYDASVAIAGNRWSARQKLEYFRAMCRAVQRIHRERVAHRDLKPSNFLIMSDGTLRLSDFGAARMIAGSRNGIAAIYTGPPGDLRYVSPEMMATLHDMNPSFAFRGDIYALGAILFELFTGTVLNLHVLNGNTLAFLNHAMNAVPPDQRVQTYNGFVSALASGHPLPSVGLFGGQAPPSIVGLIDRLFRSLAALDYRARKCDFVHIFMQIDRCLYVLDHDAAYHRWREQKRMFGV